MKGDGSLKSWIKLKWFPEVNGFDVEVNGKLKCCSRNLVG